MHGEKSGSLIKQQVRILSARGGRLVKVLPRESCGDSKSPLDKQRNLAINGKCRFLLD